MPSNGYNSNIQDHRSHHSKYKNNENVWNILRLTEMWHRDQSEQMLLENGASTLAWCRVATNLHFFFFKVASVEQKKGKCNRMRHACLLLNVSTHLSTSLFLFNRGCQSIALWAKGVLFVYRLKPEWFLRFLLVGQNQENNNILWHMEIIQSSDFHVHKKTFLKKFIFGYAGSLLLRRVFLWLQRAGTAL